MLILSSKTTLKCITTTRTVYFYILFFLDALQCRTTFLQFRKPVTKLQNAQMVVRIRESAYDDGTAHKFLHTAHKKNQHYRYLKCGALRAPEYNQT